MLKIQDVDSCSLEKSKNRDISSSFDQSPLNLAWVCNSTLVTHPTVKNL